MARACRSLTYKGTKLRHDSKLRYCTMHRNTRFGELLKGLSLLGSVSCDDLWASIWMQKPTRA